MIPAATGPNGWVLFLGGLATGGALLSYVLIRILRPWLVRYALARPSARGLHLQPTPQGGGIAVLAACGVVAGGGGGLLAIGSEDTLRLLAVLAAAAGLAVLGFVDDVRPLPPLPRLLGQLLAMAVGVIALPAGTRVLPIIPSPLETALLIVGGAWFINLTNFMDGMDWMTVVEIIPVTLTLVVAWAGGELPAVPGLIALGLLAGLVGYAPYNRPVARLFLGDVGSLPIGFLVAYGLYGLAGYPHALGFGPLTGAILLVLYYLADSGLTLLWRLKHRHRVWEPHRSHFYQVAIARGLTVPAVLRRVVAANLALCLLATASFAGSPAALSLYLALGGLVVAATLASLSRGAPVA